MIALAGLFDAAIKIEITLTEQRLTLHSPDPRSSGCRLCKSVGVCDQYGPIARQVGDLRRERDARANHRAA
ncbi:hypothetical protein Afil01_33580 [Actinorhabdospora filicis]|uniref:Uncharacterized protein n=1 Tax=Actinorhabdospora filicis TaxID=1785913 RepID=A0A9W6SPV3_9ACTN|nr:hypothetical protein [Actinorhabdospora filicis]GLZ78551.1 hypothetical protein Afil01_33580 [Actinorhabdospora filicis]